MSLLRRIEQGNNVPETPGQTQESETRSKLINLQARRVAAPGGNAQRDTYLDLKTRELLEQVMTEKNMVLSRPERHRLFEQIAAEILGLGPLQPLLEDDNITEVMVNGAKNIYIERGGKILRVPYSFESDDHVMRIIDRIVSPLGRRVDEASPYVDARLPDGSRVNAVIPPIS